MADFRVLDPNRVFTEVPQSHAKRKPRDYLNLTDF